MTTDYTREELEQIIQAALTEAGRHIHAAHAGCEGCARRAAKAADAFIRARQRRANPNN